MPSWKDDYPEKYLKASHLQNRDVVITIEKVSKVEIFDRQTNKPAKRYAAHFPGKDLLLLLNKTNLQKLQDITQTDQWDQWKNIRVVLSPKSTRLGDTIVISRAQQAQAQVDGRNTQMHGQQAAAAEQTGLFDARPASSAARPADAGSWREEEPVRGADTADESHASMRGVNTVHGPDEDEDFMGEDDAPEQEVEQRGEHYDKSAEPGLQISADALFFSITDLQAKCKDLHNESTAPMSDQQHAFVVRNLTAFTGKDALTIMSMLIGRPVTDANHAGEKVGKYLYDLFREGGPFPGETATLKDFARDYLPKNKTR